MVKRRLNGHLEMRQRFCRLRPCVSIKSLKNNWGNKWGTTLVSGAEVN